MLKLDINLGNESPTESQIANAFSDMNKFLNRVIGMVMASGDATAADERIAFALNAATMMQKSADLFRGASAIQGAQLRAVPPAPGAQRQ